MTVISAAAVKELREKTGAGMMDCQKALKENNGDFEAAVDFLRKKGLAAAAKKSSRVAAEGLVCVAAQDNKACVLEVNSETDFVARNEKFQNFVTQTTQAALQHNCTAVEALQQTAANGTTVTENLTNLIATIGENMTLRRVETLSVSQGVVASYIHNAVAPNLGKIGVLVALESAASADKLQELGKKIAMHVAAAQPLFLDSASVDATALERERAILIEQAKASGKPMDIIEKMVEGRIRKYYEEVCLVDQIFVMDGESKISAVIANTAKELGSPITLKAFTRFALGEGIEKEEKNFADEVKAAIG